MPKGQSESIRRDVGCGKKWTRGIKLSILGGKGIRTGTGKKKGDCNIEKEEGPSGKGKRLGEKISALPKKRGGNLSTLWKQVP